MKVKLTNIFDIGTL